MEIPGGRHWYKALTQEQADKIRDMVGRGSSQAATARAFGIGTATVCRLINGQQRRGLA